MPWHDEPPLPEPRVMLAAATGDAPAPGSGTWIYVMGNWAYGSPPWAGGTVVAYDPQAHSWSTVAPLPTARQSLAATSTPGRVHALGGSEDTGATAAHSIYEPATNTWSAGAPLPTARTGLAAVTGPDGLVYALGGLDPLGPVLAAVDAYDPVADTWAPKAPMPTPRVELAAVTGHDGLIYALGGQDSIDSGPLATVEIYDPATGTWTSGSPLPSATSALAAAVGPNGLIYAIGGHGADYISTASVYSYDPTTPAAGWAQWAPMPTARSWLAAATGPDGLVYAIGGANSQGPTSPVDTPWFDTVEAFAFNPSDGFEQQILDELKEIGIVGTLLGGVASGAGVGIWIGKHFIPIPPRSPAMSFILGAAAPYLAGAIENRQLSQLIQQLRPDGAGMDTAEP
jgi:hypothetical protein